MIVAAFLLMAAATNAQQQTALFLESTSTTGVQEAFYKQVSERSGDFIYTTGATISSSGHYDIILSKYSLSNVLQWSVTYSSAGNDDDVALDLAFDTNGDIIVVGTVQTGTLDSDCITLKYDDDGTLLWSQTYSGSSAGLDGLSCVVTDASNNIYVSGAVYQGLTNLTDMVLIKYNSSGTQQWASTWNNSTYNLQDASFRILLSGSYAYCYGASQISASPVQWKLANAQFYQSNGNLYGSSTSAGDDDVFHEIKDVILDGNYYTTVCGYENVTDEGRNLKVVKFNNSLTSVWSYTYNNASDLDDVANSIEMYSGVLYIGGYTTAAIGNKDFFAAKLNYSTGSQSWQTSYDAGTDENDELTDVMVDASGALYGCGNSHKVGNSDFYVAKLKNTTGEVLASNRWNGTLNDNDMASNMVVATAGIYVAGQEGTGDGGYKYALTKWSEKTVYVPVPADGYSSSGG